MDHLELLRSSVSADSVLGKSLTNGTEYSR